MTPSPSVIFFVVACLYLWAVVICMLKYSAFGDDWWLPLILPFLVLAMWVSDRRIEVGIVIAALLILTIWLVRTLGV